MRAVGKEVQNFQHALHISSNIVQSDPCICSSPSLNDMALDDSPPEDGLIHDEVEIEDFEYDSETDLFTYPCPCGDEFIVSREDLENGGKYAKCPSCSLMVQVIFNPDDLVSIIETKSEKKSTGVRKVPAVRATK